MSNKKPAHNKKYMIIAVSVLIAEFTARNNIGAARQENSPQSATTYISERCGQLTCYLIIINHNMKTSRVFLILMLILSTFSCDKDDNKTNISLDKVSGFVQKGPYLNGTTITISELSSDLIPTGKNFNSQILDNKGSFEIKDVTLSSQYVELIANGFYYNEINNENSVAQLTLFALSDLVDKSTLNVNTLSHLEKMRVEYLISNGSSFIDAKKQAQSEILKIFEIKKSDIQESENLDISQSGDDNAILLAISVILQGYLSVADLSELLANIGTDIREDGVLNSKTLGVTLINNAKVLKTTEIRDNLQNRYESLGLDVTVSDFEKYVKQFIDSTDFIATNNITYPKKYNSQTNVLIDSSFVVSPGIIYSIAAYLPVGTSIKIVCKPSIGYDWGAAGFATPDATGILIEDNYPNNLTFTAIGNDQIVNVPVLFGGGAPVTPTSIDFFIYENNSEVYTRLKTVKTF